MHVWAKGDRCLAPYSEDGENEDYYEGKIDKIMKIPGTTRTVAVVTFNGFEDDGQEAFDICKLKKPKTLEVSRKSDDVASSDEEESRYRVQLFSQEKDKNRIRMLYDDSDEDEESQSRRLRRLFTDSTESKKQTLKRPVVKSSEKSSTAASTPTRLKNSKMSEPTSPVSNENGESSANTVPPAVSEFTGFTDDDLERPRFRHVHGGEKVPLVLSPAGATPVVQVPATINQYLRDYQREGIQFLYRNFAKGKGAILADDMGLGKTVQVIGFIAAILGRTGTKTDVMKQVPKFIRRLSDPNVSIEEDEARKIFLIIGPASVLYNWVDEFETWGYFTVGKFHQSHKDETIADLHKNKLDVVVTTYETCRDNLDIMNEFKWTAVIADEAHKIKGTKAEITVALKRLKCKKRYGLSGTVLQNDMKELWCVLDWANPKCLGTLTQFESKFDRRISRGQRRDASKRELAEARKAKQEFGKLRAQWMLRRTKAIIADQLPMKDQKVVYCQPTSFQVSVYKAILGHKLMRAVLTQNHPCPCDSKRSRGKCCHSVVKDDAGREYPMKSVTMTFMHLLMKVSNHVALLLPRHTDSEEQQLRGREICNVAFAEHPQFLQQTRSASFRTLSDPKYCGKMKVLCGLLSVFKKEKSKVLVFSLSTRLLDILEQYIISKGYEYRRLDGKTPNVRRTQLVREFNKDRSIFLFIASTKAGGIGLNLTGANVVVIFDPNWNPSHDLQAEDRAYRIGQGRDVRVLRLISSGTIEEMVYLRQIYKQQLDKVAVSDENARRLFHGVQGDSKNTGELFGISNLFKFREGESTLTADILLRNEQTEAGLKGFQVVDYVPVENDSEKEDSSANYEQQQENIEETGDDMYGADALLTSLFDSDDESKDKPSPIKKKRDILDSLSEEESDSPKPSTSAGTKDSRESRKRTLPRNLQVNPDADDVSKLDAPVMKRGRQRSFGSSPAESFDCLSDVFEKCGVVHTHDNRRVVGRSKAEDYMSRMAIQEVYELHQNSQEPAVHCDPLSSSEESDDFGSVISPVDKHSKVNALGTSTEIQQPNEKSDDDRPPKKKRSSVKKRLPMKKSPVKHIKVAKGCELGTLSSDDEVNCEETEKQNCKAKNSKTEMTDLKKREQNDVSVVKSPQKRNVSVVNDSVKLPQTQSGLPLPDDDDDGDRSFGNTQSIIDNLLGICDAASTKRSPSKTKPKPQLQKTVATSESKRVPDTEKSQEDSDSMDVKDTLAILDDIFSEEPGKVKAAPKRNKAKQISIDLFDSFD